MPLIGFLSAASPDITALGLRNLRQGLGEAETRYCSSEEGLAMTAMIIDSIGVRLAATPTDVRERATVGKFFWLAPAAQRDH